MRNEMNALETPRLTVDAVDSIEQNVATILAYVQAVEQAPEVTPLRGYSSSE